MWRIGRFLLLPLVWLWGTVWLVRRRTVVRLPLKGRLLEGETPFGLLRNRRRGRVTLPEIVRTCEAVAADPSVKVLFVRVDDFRAGWAGAQTVRRALAHVRAAGTRVILYADTLTNLTYYVATGASEIWMPPVGHVLVRGLYAEVSFFGGLLQRLGIQAEVEALGEYKVAFDTAVRRDMSEPHREMVTTLLDDLAAQFVAGIAEGRSMTLPEATAAIDAGPAPGDRARARRLIDVVLYPDEVDARLKSVLGEKPRMVSARAFLVQATRRAMWRLRARPVTVAVLHLLGPLVMGEREWAGAACRAPRMARALAHLRRNRGVQAVVLRIHSPGGTDQASDLIARAVAVTAADKPVVASLGDVAASGAYYAAAAARRIVAESGSLTGSIGVLAGRVHMAGLYERLGISVERFSRGAMAGIFSRTRPLTAVERAHLRGDVQWFYDRFVDHVTQGRNLPREAVEAAARGRVFTGAQAQTRGLVDAVGGLGDAVTAAAMLAGATPGTPVRLVIVPQPRRWSLVARRLGITETADEDSPLVRAVGFVRALAQSTVWAILPWDIRIE